MCFMSFCYQYVCVETLVDQADLWSDVTPKVEASGQVAIWSDVTHRGGFGSS